MGDEVTEIKSNLVLAAEWLWTQRGRDMRLHAGLLTGRNPDSKAPKLSVVEANRVFQALLEKRLLIGRIVDSQAVYFVNDDLIAEWKELISETNAPWGKRWTAIKPLSGGGQGDTILVREKSTETARAVLKVLKPAKVNDPKARRRMAQEVTNLKVLHSAGGKVPKVLDGNTDQFEDATTPLFFVMEFIDGTTLADLIHQANGVPFGEAIGITLELCFTVELAIKEGIVHRDIKPENIMVRGMNPPDVFMVDFGLSFNEDEDLKLTSADEALDNKFLSLPERRGPGENKRDSRSDITGVCAILFYCLTACSPRNLSDSMGRPPHRWPGFILNERVQNPSQLTFLNALLDTGLSYQIDSRFQTISHLLNRLNEIKNPSQEVPDEDLDSVIEREANALRRNDRKTQIAEIRRNARKFQSPLANHLDSINQKLSKVQQFQMTSDDLLKPDQKQHAEGDSICSGSLTVSVRNHGINHIISYRIIATGMDCTLYRETVEVIAKQGSHFAGQSVTRTAIGPPVVVARYHGGYLLDVKIWFKDIERAISQSISALSQKIQNGYNG